jgi:vacuolar-type H+-ATPase subunit I/STV1
LSTPAKAILLKGILPNDPSVKTALGREASKLESNALTLSSEKMTTEMIVGRIKELSKLRDEIIQVMRQLSISREPGTKLTDQLRNYDELDSLRQEIDETRNRYLEIQGKIDGIQRQIDDSKKLILGLTELSKTGFTVEQLESEVNDFHRVLGRVPFKKLNALEKAVQSQFKNQAILAIGSKGRDVAYILVATSKEKSSQALQTLLLHDFSQVEIPEIRSSDPKAEIRAQEDKLKTLTMELEELKRQHEEIRKTSGVVLNGRLDEISGSLILLRGTLKLGEGAQASRIYARLEKPLPAPTLSELTKKGVIELETLS